MTASETTTKHFTVFYVFLAVVSLVGNAVIFLSFFLLRVSRNRADVLRVGVSTVQSLSSIMILWSASNYWSGAHFQPATTLCNINGYLIATLFGLDVVLAPMITFERFIKLQPGRFRPSVYLSTAAFSLSSVPITAALASFVENCVPVQGLYCEVDFTSSALTTIAYLIGGLTYNVLVISGVIYCNIFMFRLYRFSNSTATPVMAQSKAPQVNNDDEYLPASVKAKNPGRNSESMKKKNEKHLLVNSAVTVSIVLFGSMPSLFIMGFKLITKEKGYRIYNLWAMSIYLLSNALLPITHILLSKSFIKDLKKIMRRK
jgi:TRAP-type C4-dicarboxylate transport system permease small subunit